MKTEFSPWSMCLGGLLVLVVSLGSFSIYQDNMERKMIEQESISEQTGRSKFLEKMIQMILEGGGVGNVSYIYKDGSGIRMNLWADKCQKLKNGAYDGECFAEEPRYDFCSEYMTKQVFKSVENGWNFNFRKDYKQVECKLKKST